MRTKFFKYCISASIILCFYGLSWVLSACGEADPPTCDSQITAPISPTNLLPFAISFNTNQLSNNCTIGIGPYNYGTLCGRGSILFPLDFRDINNASDYYNKIFVKIAVKGLGNANGCKWGGGTSVPVQTNILSYNSNSLYCGFNVKVPTDQDSQVTVEVLDICCNGSRNHWRQDGSQDGIFIFKAQAASGNSNSPVLVDLQPVNGNFGVCQ
jgi:hypothetical protein